MIGSRVQALRPDHYLLTYHQVDEKTVGTVVASSRLAHNDGGYLVDWGDGRTVRMEPGELIHVVEFDLADVSEPTDLDGNPLRPLRELLAAAWDEGHSHCFHVDPPHATTNPYRLESPR